MDYQTIYNEAMVKLAEAQKCQNEITEYNKELQQENNAIAEAMFSTDIRLNYLNYKHTTLNNEINNRIRERDEKLNEALSKALDIVDCRTGNHAENISTSIVAIGNIISFIKANNIQLRYSLEVNMKLAKITAKGIDCINRFLSQQRMFGW